MNRTLILAVAGACAVFASPALAQPRSPQELYGHAVHDYFSGDYESALVALDDAVKSESDDPRVYYYKGLVLVALGRPDEAQEPWKKGGELEAVDATKFYSVSKALERIQGPVRIALETWRTEGRTRWVQKRMAEYRARYGRLMRDEPAVIDRPASPDRLKPTADVFSDDPGQSKPGAAAPQEDPAPKQDNEAGNNDA